MCRGTDEGGRRCPCDGSAARQARRMRVKAAKQYSPVLTRTSDEPALNSLPETPTVVDTVKLVEEIRENIDALREQLETTKYYTDSTIKNQTPEDINAYTAIDALTQKAGANIDLLAVEKYGAPTDETIKEKCDSWAKDNQSRKSEAMEADRAAYKTRMDYRATFVPLAIEKYEEETGNRYSSLTAEQRNEYLEKHYPAQYEKYNTYINEELKTSAAVQLIRSEESPNMELLKQRAEAHKQALQDAGVEFAEAGSINTGKGSNKPAVEALTESTTLLPKRWVEASNAAAERFNQPLVVKSTKSRAHYMASKTVTRLETTIAFNGIYPHKTDPNIPANYTSKFYPMPKNGEWVHPVNKDKKYKALSSLSGDYAEMQQWVEVGLEVTPIEQTGKGWEKYVYETKKWDAVNKKYSEEEVTHTVWRKELVRKEKVNKGRIAELTISGDPEPNPMSSHSGATVALHEFGHRAQDTVPHLKKLEHAFIQRRAKLQTDTPEARTTIYAGKKEYGYKDSFAAHYIGKTYPDGSTEVTSMGLQMLWNGKSGAFTGINDHKADPDMKHFMLGMLAATSK